MNPPRIEIAQIVADGRPGGGTTMMLGLIDDLAADPALHITVVSQPGSYIEREVLRRGLPYIGFDFFRLGPNPALPWLLARKLAPRRFDLTHLHGLRAAHHAIGWPVRRALGRLVYTIHGQHQFHFHPLIRWAANRAEREVMRRADRCVFVSHADLANAIQWNLLPDHGPAPLVIWNGIDIEAARRLAVAAKDIDVAFVGRLDEPKQPLQAVRVLAGLAARGWRCAFAGGGPLEVACRELLRKTPGGDAVQLLGELSHQAALELLGRTRVVIMPSAWEGLPILPMEAMALGATLVGTNVPGIAEVVASGVTGILVPPGDISAMTHAAERVLEAPGLQREMTLAASQRVREHFDRHITSQHYRDIYRAALQAGRCTDSARHPQNAR